MNLELLALLLAAATGATVGLVCGDIVKHGDRAAARRALPLVATALMLLLALLLLVLWRRA